MTERATRVRFGRFEFDQASGELYRDGVARTLQPQPARMLALLIDQAGTLVTRQQLRDALWAPDVHVDYERGLNFCASQIRAALGDSASSPHYIETVPKRGYRFLGSVAHVAPDESAASTAAASAGGQGFVVNGRRPSRVRWTISATAALIALLGGAYVLSRSAARPPHVAVVPFDNETGLAEGDRIAKAISDAAVAQLAAGGRLERVKVIGNAAELRFTFRPRDLKKMAESVGAQFVVLGQLKHGADGYRVIAHLIRVSDQTHVWASTFDRRTLDLADQAEIAGAIASAVANRVGAN